MRLQTCLNAPARIYGLNAGMVIFGGIFLVLVWMITDFIPGLVGMGAGLLIGNYVHNWWHKGLLQKYYYWYLGNKFLPRMPDSKEKIFY